MLCLNSSARSEHAMITPCADPAVAERLLEMAALGLHSLLPPFRMPATPSRLAGSVPSSDPSVVEQ